MSKWELACTPFSAAAAKAAALVLPPIDGVDGRAGAVAIGRLVFYFPLFGPNYTTRDVTPRTAPPVFPMFCGRPVSLRCSPVTLLAFRTLLGTLRIGSRTRPLQDTGILDDIEPQWQDTLVDTIESTLAVARIRGKGTESGRVS